MTFQSVSKSVTLNDLESRNDLMRAISTVGKLLLTLRYCIKCSWNSWL